MTSRVRKRPAKFIEETDDGEVKQQPKRQAKKKQTNTKPVEDEDNKKQMRKCEKSGCPAAIPICFANACDRCTGSGMTSRWYHLSPGEHFCNDCFDYFYRSHRDGYAVMIKWKKQWSAVGRTEASLKAFMNDQFLPFWVQCTKPECKKWRQLSRDFELKPNFIRNYQCGMQSSSKIKDACDSPEDERAQQAQGPYWINTLILPPFLKSSPAAPFLLQYFPDGVGMSATSSMPKKEETMHQNYEPFLQPDDPVKAMCVRPDMMEADELHEFPEFSREQQMYLGLRNIVITLWNLRHRDLLTPETCAPFVICRGLVRVRCMMEIERIILFLTRKGLVNTGLMRDIPPAGILPPECNKDNVIIIGAGPAGLGAARQLKNFGTKVTVLEARSRVGGRVEDDWSLGACIGRGAQLVYGCINNPMTLLCDQASLELKHLPPECTLVNESGEVISEETSKRIEFHFNALLDIVADWRKDRALGEDKKLIDKIQEMHKQFIEESQLGFSENEMKLLQLHISNLECTLGADLSQVSALNWDQHENYAQFGGEAGILPEGYLAVLTRLAEGIDIKLNQEVSEINYEDGTGVAVKTKGGEMFTGTKVIVTVPLSVLQQNTINFIPELPELKIKAIKSLGAGIVEKVAIKFPTKFWKNKLGKTECFGHIPSDEKQRGLCSIFYDVSPPGFDLGILTTYLSGQSLMLLKDNTELEIIKMIVKVLKKMFPEATVPSPSSYFISHWSEDKYSQMAYSYIPVGCPADCYNVLAEDIVSKVYFAGEATNQRFPGSVTGAYLSGIREAGRIALSSWTSP